jgi:hypothetical protein
MLQAAPQFTPFQLLDAGRRAEADGQIEAAVQFYRQTVDQYAYGPEAAQAREGLARLTGSWQPKIWQVNGAAPQQGEAGNRASGSARKGRRSKPPATHNPYWIGKALARLVSLFGCLIAAGGLAAAASLLLIGRADMSQPELGFGSIGVLAAAAVALLGLVTVALGQATRALLEQANATRELVALQRTKSRLD